MCLNEAGQVGGRRVERGRGERREAIVNRRRAIDVVEFRDVRHRRVIHVIRRSRHAERQQHRAPQIVVERLSGGFLDDQLQQRITASRVLEGAARLETDANSPIGAGRRVGRTGQGRHDRLDRLARRKSAVAEAVGQSRGVAQEAADVNAAVVERTRRQGPAREIGRHGRVEIELPGLDQGHHAPRRDPLAQGGDLEQRVAIDGLAGRREVLAEDLSVLDQDEGDIAAACPVDRGDRCIHEGSACRPKARATDATSLPRFPQ